MLIQISLAYDTMLKNGLTCRERVVVMSFVVFFFKLGDNIQLLGFHVVILAFNPYSSQKSKGK